MASSIVSGLVFTKPSTRSLTAPKIRSDRWNARSRQFFTTRAAVTADRASLDITKVDLFTSSTGYLAVQMEPLGDRVLVKPLEAEDKTEGGVLLPSSATDTGRDACFGEVLSVGNEVELKLKKGDKVVFNMFSSAKVEVADGEIIFLHDKNILATLE